MKIIFNLINTGLGNNGGSYTIIASANTLVKLGHNVTIIDTGANKNTWLKLEAEHLIIKDLSKIPDADVIIGTGIKTFDSTSKSKIKKKFLWIRGWETWNVDNNQFVNSIRNSKCNIIVNSSNLKNKLEKYSIKSKIVMPGYDFNILRPLDIRKNNDKINLGGIYNFGVKREKKRTEWIFKVYEDLKKEFPLILNMYGSDGISNKCDYFLQNPSLEQKNYLYNKCDIWLSPTCLEGLHIPPAEAGITECCVVGTNAELNGMSDYLKHCETGLISKNNYEDFKLMIYNAINGQKLRECCGKNLRLKIMEIGSREYNMFKLIEIMEKYNE